MHREVQVCGDVHHVGSPDWLTVSLCAEHLLPITEPRRLPGAFPAVLS